MSRDHASSDRQQASECTSLRSAEAPSASVEFAAFSENLDQLMKNLHTQLGDDDREELLAIRRRAERSYRRLQLSHPECDSDVYIALWWFSENGDATDLSFLGSLRLESHQELRDMAIGDIKKRNTAHTPPFDLNTLLYPAICVCAASVFISLAIVGPSRSLSSVTLSLGLTLVVGFGASGLLIAAAMRDRPLLTRACFASAGVLLLTEVASVIHKAALLIRR